MVGSPFGVRDLVALITSRIGLDSAWASRLDCTTMSCGHWSGSGNQGGLFIHRSVRLPPRLPISAGLSVVETCLQVISALARILDTRLATNCLQLSVPLIHHRATVESDQAVSLGSGRWFFSDL